jgi:DNA-binding transcriptional MerR regulator
MEQLSLFNAADPAPLVEEVAVPLDKPADPVLTKVYYTITEVAAMFKVNASMLRFWEKEFPVQLSKVKKNKKGDRYYNAQDIEKVKLLYHLIKERKMTHEGARDFLKDNKKKVKDDVSLIENLQAIRSFLQDLKKSITD